jgi:N-acetylmuramoyl-L-alanine amidase
LFVYSLPLPAASDLQELRNIRYWSSPEYTRIVCDMSGGVTYTQNRLSNPDRLYFDLKNTSLPAYIKRTLLVKDGILRTVRAGQFSQDTVRIVFDLEAFTEYKTFLLENPSRLIIDVYGSKKEAKPDTFITKRRIILDPGHGGHDPGAVGPRKLYEKTVVLDIAKKVQKILSGNPMNEVFLTRDSDIFIPLEERTVIANRKRADLFVSIHANASTRRQAKGYETYLLNWTDDEEAMRVAARENAITLKQMKEMHRKMDIVSVITDDLMRQTKRDESIKLAHYIQRSMVSSLGSSCDLGVKQALFYVLFGAKMPSVLVEVSFISNPLEERLLSDDSYRMRIAKAIAEGVMTYFNSVPAVQKVTELKLDRPVFR